MPGDKLTPRQEAFVAEYLKDFNAGGAARRAGYSSRTADQTASRLLRVVKVQAAINRAVNERRNRVQVSADQVLAMLITEARRTGEGSSHSARVRATELLGKHVGMFDDKLQVEHSGQIGPRTIEIVPLRPDESETVEDAPADSAVGISARNGGPSV